MNRRTRHLANVHLFRSFAVSWKRLALLCIVMFLFQLLFAAVGASAEISREMASDLKKTPAVVEKMMGKGFMEAMLKYGVMALGYIHPFIMVLFIVYIMMTMSQVITSEIASGRIVFVLTRGLSRGGLFVNLALLVWGGLGLMALSAVGGTALGLAWFHSGGVLTPEPFVSLAWSLYVLMVFIAGYLSILAARFDNGKGLFTAGAAWIAFLYLLNLAAPLWTPLKSLLFFNPFAYYDSFAVLMGARLGWGKAALLLGVSALLFAIGGIIFSRRDVAAG